MVYIRNILVRITNDIGFTGLVTDCLVNKFSTNDLNSLTNPIQFDNWKPNRHVRTQRTRLITRILVSVESSRMYRLRLNYYDNQTGYPNSIRCDSVKSRHTIKLGSNETFDTTWRTGTYSMKVDISSYNVRKTGISEEELIRLFVYSFTKNMLHFSFKFNIYLFPSYVQIVYPPTISIKGFSSLQTNLEISCFSSNSLRVYP